MEPTADEITRAAYRMLIESGAHQEFAEWCRREFRWRGSLRNAVSRVSQWTNPRNPHRLPGDAIPGLIATTGLDLITPILLRVRLRRQRMARRSA